MVKFAVETWCLAILLLTETTVGAPIEAIEEIYFDDPWDYNVVSSNVPILKSPSKYHVLPVPPKRMAKSNDYNFEEVYDIQALGGTGEPDSLLLTCSKCRLAVTLLRGQLSKNASVETIKKLVIGVCVGLKIEVESVCAGAFDIYAKVVLPALKSTDLDSEKICSLLLGEACGDVENPVHEWYIDLSSEKPEHSIWDSPPPKADGPTFKVLQLSDTHFDPQYVEGAPANCDEPLCCRSYSRAPENGSLPAGKWGSYTKCDTPKILIENMMDHIATQHPDIDYIIWTGDVPPHDIWNQTREQNIDNIKYTVDLLLAKFPNIPIFPALGNHDSLPEGNFPPPWMKHQNQSIDWLYSVLAAEWSNWLPKEANKTVIHGAYYSVLLRPHFRIISLNMNYCYALNWWLVLNSTDPAQELKWLAYELHMAEVKGDKVHIIGHIPPGGSDCIKVWSKNYYDIINRYKDTVVAQFFGHTHNDEFEIFYDDFKMPTAIAYIGPSVTTFEHVNPAYRIYYVDGDHNTTTREVIDHETWILDLAKTNANPDLDPEWFKLYSAKSAYNMDTLRPKDWGTLIDLMVTNDELFQQFHRYLYHASPVRPKCDNKCKFRVICDLKSAKSHERHNLCHTEEEMLLPRV